MGRSLSRRIAAALALATVSGCSLFVSLDDLTGGSSGAGSDSGLDGALGDGATSDGSRQGDGGASDDGGNADGSGGGSPCDDPHTFCDDFDQPGETVGDPSKWTSFSAPNPAFLSLSTSQYDSPPASLAAFYQPDAGDSFLEDGVVKDFSGDFVHAHCGFNVRLGALDSTSSLLYVADISADTPDGQNVDLIWAIWDNTTGDGDQSITLTQTYADGGEDDDTTHLDDALTLRTWYHGSLDLSIPDGGTPVFTLFIDGNKVTETPVGTWSKLSDLELVLGATGDPTNDNDHVYFDNVYCDLN